MRAANDALISMLGNNNEFVVADLYKFTMATGAVLRYTTLDTDVVYDDGTGAATYVSNSVLLDRNRIKSVIGVEVDVLDLAVTPHPSDAVSGTAFLQAAAAGNFDGASLTLYRTFLDSSNLVVDGFTIFSGRVADIIVNRINVQFSIKSDLELLNIELPKNLYQAGCLNTLYDARCGVDRTAYAVTANINSATKVVLTSTLSNPAAYFDMGYVEFVSGTCNGVKRTIKSYDGTSINLLNPLPFTPAIGDQFKAYPGCDKKEMTCGPITATFTADPGTNQITSTSGWKSKLNNEITVSSTGNLPSGLAASTSYFVIAPTANADWTGGKVFRLSATVGGAAINIASAGTGIHSTHTVAKFNNLANFRGYPWIPVPETTR